MYATVKLCKKGTTTSTIYLGFAFMYNEPYSEPVVVLFFA